MTRFALLFPGQGAQHPGMGRELAECFPESRAVFEAVDRALGEPLSRLCFEGDAATLALTENTQPAILAASIAALRALEARGLPSPAAAAGHSLGEWSAHVAAGTLDLADAARAVRLRGRFMQEAVPLGTGAMAALIGLAPDEVRRLCEEAREGEVVAPANLNGPDQVVIAGHRAAVERASAAARDAGALRAVPLAVSAPFHCALMEPAARRLSDVLETLDLRDPSFPVYTNADALPVRDAAAARRALLRQVASPVRWHELIEAMLAAGISTFVEVGPGRVLAGLLRRIRRDVSVVSAGDRAGVEQVMALLGGGN